MPLKAPQFRAVVDASQKIDGPLMVEADKIDKEFHIVANEMDQRVWNSIRCVLSVGHRPPRPTPHPTLPPESAS